MKLDRHFFLGCVIALLSTSFVTAAENKMFLTCTNEEEFTIIAEQDFFPNTGLYKGKLRGFSFDIMMAAFSAVNCRPKIRVTPYKRCLNEIETGRALGCFNTTNSSENQRKYILHKKPLFRGEIFIYGHPDSSGLFSQSDYYSNSFSVVRGYTYTDDFDSDTRIKKIIVGTDKQTLALVSKKRADFALVYKKVAQFEMNRITNTIASKPVPVKKHVGFDLFVSFSKKKPEKSLRLASILDNGLNIIRANGTYAKIEKSWKSWLKTGLKYGNPAPLWQSE